jgi:hypothetical protein
MNDKQYMSLDAVSRELGITKPSLAYYIKVLSIQKQKFLLDRHVYIHMSDFEKIKTLKQDAETRGV